MCQMKFSPRIYRWWCEEHDEKGDQDGCLTGTREDIVFYKNSMERIAKLLGIETPLQLIALAENNKENYVDLLEKYIKIKFLNKQLSE